MPQGTIFWPLLFNIYINGIMELLENNVIFCFADDIAIFINVSSWDKAKENPELALH